MSRVLRLTRGRVVPAIGLSADDATITVADGGSSVTINLTIARTNYTGTITLAVSGLPSGVTGTFSDSTITGAETSSVLTVSASGAAAVTDDAFTITASGSGVSDATVAGTCTVTASYTPFLSEDWSSYGSVSAAIAAHTNASGTDKMSLDSTNTYGGIQTLRYSFPAGTESALFKTFTATSAVDTTNDWITITAHGFTTARKVRYLVGSGGTAIGGLTNDTIYWAIAETADRLRLATSSANALANTYIDLTSTGTGSSQGIHATIAADGLGTGHPSMERSCTAKSNIWAKFKMRWEPGFTTNTSMGQVLGDYYASSASAYKHCGFGMRYANGRSLQTITSTNQYQTEIVINSWSNTASGGSPAPSGNASGLTTSPTNIVNEWTDGNWREYILHYWTALNGPSVEWLITFDPASAVDTTNDRITSTAHGFVTGDKVYYSMGGTSPSVIGGLTNNTIYYAIAETADRLRLATSLANAQANTYINLTSTGAGASHTIASTMDMTYRVWVGPVGGAYTQTDYSTLTVPAPQYAPHMNRFQLGQNFNKYRDPGNAVYLNWGPYELVDGDTYSDPYGVGAT